MATNIPVGIGVTSVDLDDGRTILVVTNEGACMQDNDKSLLSTFQSREQRIDNVALRHGRNQEIIADGYHIRLKIRNGFMTFNCRLPTENELLHVQGELTGDPPVGSR